MVFTRAERRVALKPDMAPGRSRCSDCPPAPMGASTDGKDVLTELRSGGRESLDRLVPLVYQELRAIAHRRIAGRDRGRTLSTTALVHEAYLKLVDQSRSESRDRTHFLAVASLAMRQVLVDRARARVALKRGGETRRLSLDEEEIAADDQPDMVLALNDSLNRLAEAEPRLARVVECRFFGGLTEDEIAEALGVTIRTVQRDWAKARMLLRRALST
jgi:RNA polymerase sigma factor (TIGR02999 family)